MNKKAQGFTIVELLIVIVVIAILAAISFVAYDKIQQRANNTKTITEAKQVVGLIQAYYAAYGEFPVNYDACATQDNKCTGSSNPNPLASNNSPLMSELKKIGVPPVSSNIPTSLGTYGISYRWHGTSKVIDGQTYPVRVEYFLQGGAQGCKLNNVANGPVNGFSGTGYSTTVDDRTTCWVMIAA